jgi:hypothetical protein
MWQRPKYRSRLALDLQLYGLHGTVTLTRSGVLVLGRSASTILQLAKETAACQSQQVLRLGLAVDVVSHRWS